MNKEPSLDYIIEDLVKSLRGTEEDWQIKSIKAFILKALKSQREEIVEEIEDKYQLVTQSPRDNVVETAKDIGYNSAIREIINLITKEDES